MLPKSMQFASTSGTSFASMNDPREPDAVVQVASNTKAGQPLAFKISGTGTMTDPQGSDQQGASQAGGGTTTGRDSRPGGGLGPPIEAPDPLEKYRWYILGGFALVMAAGAIYITNRSRHAPVPDFGLEVELSESPAPKRKPSGPSQVLLEALKDQM